MTAVATAPSARTQPTTRTARTRVRTLRIIHGNPPYSGRVSISVDAATTLYDVEQTQLDPAFGPGRAFIFQKRFPNGQAAGEGYRLTVTTTDQDADAPVIDCECLGHRHYGHCRHADCLLALLKTRQK